MIFKLKTSTAKKKREQLYLSMFLTVVIWVLLAVLFYADQNRQVILIYLLGSVVLLPWIYVKKLRPYLHNLNSNIETAYFQIEDQRIRYHHFENLKNFNTATVEFDITDIVNLKKAFRKDDSINKITLTLKDKSKIVVEDFENMSELVASLVETRTQE